MKLNRLIKDIQYTQMVIPKDEVEICGISIDSRNVKEGYAFIAMRGTQTDGHAYIDAAEANGAVAIICETMPL